MNLLNIVLTVFYLSFGLVLFNVPFAGLVALVSSLVAGVIYLVNLIKSA